jgi:hypothetical protein
MTTAVGMGLEISQVMHYFCTRVYVYIKFKMWALNSCILWQGWCFEVGKMRLAE